MKLSIIAVFVLMPVVTFAQQPSMNEQDMQKMMEQAQKMQACMQGLDQNELQRLEQSSHQMEAEIKALCADGKRQEAENKAIAYGMEIAKDPTVKTMRQCGEMMKGVMPQIPFVNQDATSSSKHICD